jgi:hypothetical protein
MALYLVVHDPNPGDEERVRPPTRLRELAEATRGEHVLPRWIKAWSPGLHDDRIFTMWEARSAAEITATLEEFGFLDDYTAKPFQVREWGPDDVLVGGE